MAFCASPFGTHLTTCAGSSLSSQLRVYKGQSQGFRLQWDPLRVAKYRFWQGHHAQAAQLFRRGPQRTMNFLPQANKATCESLHVSCSHDSKAEKTEKIFTLVEKQQRTFLQRVTEAAAACFAAVGRPAVACVDVMRRPAVVALIVSLLLTQIPDAWAASGGMMGGRAFSSGGGRSSGSAGRAFSAPRSSFSFSAPYAAPSPFFGGGFGPSIYVAPAYGFGIGGGSSFLILLLGFLAFFFISGFLTDRTQSNLFTSTSKTSVLKLQVGLLGMARSLQQDLDQIAERADTSAPSGLHHILTETVLSLLRHPDYCISGYASADVKRDSESGEKLFNELSLEERAKFDEETIVNDNSIFRRGPSKAKSGFNNEYIVVTVLVAAEGELKLPAINSNADLKETLRKLGSIPKDQILAVEVLWTPQDQNDTLSERELLRDYPLLRSL